MKTYQKYKNSGVDWIGRIPEHWGTKKLRHILMRIADRNRSDLPLLSVVREKGVILRNVSSREENHNYIPDDLSNYKVVLKGQFAMNKMKAWQGSYGVSSFDGIVSPAYFVFQIDGVGQEFFHYAIRTKAYVPFFTGASDGVRIGQWDLSPHRMKEIPFFIPSESEQNNIVNFVKHIDVKIKRYIAAKQKAIKLLNEKKQTIINKAVMQGLNSDVRLKYSGVEWFGSIPEHWDILRAKYMFDSIDVRSSSGDEELLTVSSYKGIVPRATVNVYMFKAKSYAGYKLCWPRDLVINSLWAWMRGLGFSDYHGVVSTAYGVYRLADQYSKSYKYFHYLLRSDEYNCEFRIRSKGIWKSRFQLTEDAFGEIPILIPPEGEMAQIVDYISKSISSIEKSVENLEKSIGFMNEYRVRLISDVVTGKIDIGDVKLPDLGEEIPQESDDEQEISDDIEDSEEVVNADE